MNYKLLSLVFGALLMILSVSVLIYLDKVQAQERSITVFIFQGDMLTDTKKVFDLDADVTITDTYIRFHDHNVIMEYKDLPTLTIIGLEELDTVKKNKITNELKLKGWVQVP